MLRMVIDMNDSQLNSLADLSAFLDGTTGVEWVLAAHERYPWSLDRGPESRPLIRTPTAELSGLRS